MVVISSFKDPISVKFLERSKLKFYRTIMIEHTYVVEISSFSEVKCKSKTINNWTVTEILLLTVL